MSHEHHVPKGLACSGDLPPINSGLLRSTARADSLDTGGRCETARLSPAFTRLDLLASLGVLGLLICLALPGLATTKPRSERLICCNNLRQVAVACQGWADAHGDRNVWVAPYTEGGTRNLPSGLGSLAWFQFSYLSNELATPALLACPSDAGTRVARDFSASPDGGYLHANYRNNAVSYFVGLHSFYESPRSILSGDRNIKPTQVGVSCSYGGVGPVTIGLNLPDAALGWTNAIHGVTGNLLFTDGSVVEASSADLRHAVFDPATDNGRVHLLQAR